MAVAVFDFNGNVMKGGLASRTATKLVREWVDLHVFELEVDWELAKENQEIKLYWIAEKMGFIVRCIST